MGFGWDVYAAHGFGCRVLANHRAGSDSRFCDRSPGKSQTPGTKKSDAPPPEPPSLIPTSLMGNVAGNRERYHSRDDSYEERHYHYGYFKQQLDTNGFFEKLQQHQQYFHRLSFRSVSSDIEF